MNNKLKLKDSRSIMLPIIDFSSQELKQGSSTWESVKAEVRTTLEEFGCFFALYDKIPTEVRQELFDSTVELFDLPLQHKAQDIFGRDLVGYVGPDPSRPLFESLGIDNATSPEKVDSFASKIFPNGNSNLSKTIHCYIELISELDNTIRTMVLESFGLEKYKDEHMNSVEKNFRFNKYTTPNTNGTKLGLSAHTDKNLVTILDQNGTNGLEVLLKDGDEQWIEVNFFPNSLLVIIGEPFHAWTNGRLHPPHHRVMMTGNESRYTLGLFSNYKQGCMVKAPEELVDEDHPQLYNPFDFSGYLDFCKNGGFAYKSTVEAYCGI